MHNLSSAAHSENWRSRNLKKTDASQPGRGGQRGVRKNRTCGAAKSGPASSGDVGARSSASDGEQRVRRRSTNRQFEMQGCRESLEKALTKSKGRIEFCLSGIGDVQEEELEDAVVQAAEALKALSALGPGKIDLCTAWYQVDYLSLGLPKSSPALARMVLGGALGLLHPERKSLKQTDAILHLKAAHGLIFESDAQDRTGQLQACLFLLSFAFSSVCNHAEAIQTARQFAELVGECIQAIEIQLWIADECRKGREGDHKAADAARTALRIAEDQQKLSAARLKGYQITAGKFLPRDEALALLERALPWKEAGSARGDAEMCLETPEMWKGVILLLETYAELNRFREAGELVLWFDPVAEKLKQDDASNYASWVDWQDRKCTMYVAIGDYRNAARVHSAQLADGKHGDMESATTLSLWATKYAVSGEYGLAIEALNDCESLHSQHVRIVDSESLLSIIVRMYTQRGVCHYQLNEFEEALKDLEMGVGMKKEFVPSELWSLSEKEAMATNYLYQARCHIYRNSVEKAQAQVNVALGLIPKGSDLELQLGYTELLLLWHANEYEKAAALGRKCFLICAAMQSGMGRNMKAGWVTFLDGTDMTNILTKNEQVAFVDSTQPSWKPLLWSERSHMRLFMFEKAEINSDHFDQCDDYAIAVLNQAVMQCGPNTAIIAYSSYNPNASYIFVYIVTNRVNEDGVVEATYAAKSVSPQKETTTKISSMRDVDGLVTNVRTTITSNRSKPALDPKPDLALLYKILVQSVEEYLPECVDTVLFSPQGALSTVPFAALYDERDGRFLVEKKCVGIIPGFRAFHRCFHQQALFQQECTNLKEPFVAGNPEPMGCAQAPLLGAAKEAEAVAELLRVRPVVGRAMTKAAVVEGLQTSSLVLIATHGEMNKDDASEGTLVMRRADDHDCNASPPRELFEEKFLHADDDDDDASLSRRIRVRTLELRSSAPLDLASDETLTGSEIAALQVRAGLVVLGACQSGEGTVTREGLLGLGRAVLHAGAATTIVTLWVVGDDATMELIVAMMTEFCKGEKTVVECLQLAMRPMIERGRSVYEWAPLLVLGSPTLRWPLS